MTIPVNWGVLGGSNFASQHMAPAIHQADNARLYALATSSEEKAAPFRAFCPDLTVHASYDALLADDQVEAVYVPLPNHLHMEWAKKALVAGKHVLCEKPIGLHGDDFDTLIALRDQTGLLAAEAYMIVHHPQWQHARALFQGGAIGNLVHVDVAFSYFNDDANNIRNQPAYGGGGLRDIGVCTFGSTRFVTGQEPTSIRYGVADWENDVDVYAHIVADFEDFRFSSLTSMRMANRQNVVFHGDKGVIRLSAPFNAEQFGEPKVELLRAGKPDEIMRFPADKQYKNQVEDFGHTVRGDTPYPWSLEDARGTQTMLDMAFEHLKSKPKGG